LPRPAGLLRCRRTWACFPVFSSVTRSAVAGVETRSAAIAATRTRFMRTPSGGAPYAAAPSKAKKRGRRDRRRRVHGPGLLVGLGHRTEIATPAVAIRRTAALAACNGWARGGHGTLRRRLRSGACRGSLRALLGVRRGHDRHAAPHGAPLDVPLDRASVPRRRGGGAARRRGGGARAPPAAREHVRARRAARHARSHPRFGARRA